MDFLFKDVGVIKRQDIYNNLIQKHYLSRCLLSGFSQLLLMIIIQRKSFISVHFTKHQQEEVSFQQQVTLPTLSCTLE